MLRIHNHPDLLARFDRFAKGCAFHIHLDAGIARVTVRDADGRVMIAEGRDLAEAVRKLLFENEPTAAG